MGFLEKIISFFQDWINKKTGEEKRRIALICTVIFAILLTFSVIISITGSGREELPALPERSKVNIAIPAQELFLPDEPDFLPGVLFERDRRSNWTEQDAEEYWQDPLRFGEEGWRLKIETAIDEFLESVP